MKPRVKNALIWGCIAFAMVYGVWNQGWAKTVDNTLYALALYYITIGAFDFFIVWLPRYVRIKRLQKKNPGLLYLVLLREKFGELR